MVKEIVLIILLFNGETLLKPYNLIIGSSVRSHWGGTIMECLEHGDKLRKELSTHKWVEKDIMKSGWYMNNRIGTWQGFICQ